LVHRKTAIPFTGIAVSVFFAVFQDFPNNLRKLVEG
jgi:hypothetical protein